MFTLRKNTLSLFFFLSICELHTTQSSLPVVLWHGMGDSCCFSFSLGAIKKLIEATIPNAYVYSIRIGNNEVEDVEHSYFGNINEQISEVCQQLSTDKRFKDGYNAIGFSQGGQFMRAVIQRCPNPPVKNFISVGGQHQGVFGLPNCGSLKHTVCNYINRMIKYGAYLTFVQKKLLQATYWHDPYQEEEYRAKSTFMADINNERYINETYKENLQKLNAMVLIKFDNDTVVWPRETEWFGFYKPGQAKEIQMLEESDLYRKDYLGLQALAKSGRLRFLSLPGNHLQFTNKWFINQIIKPYLM